MEMNGIGLRITTPRGREYLRKQARAEITASILRVDQRIVALGTGTNMDRLSFRANSRAVFALLGAKIQLEELLELRAPVSIFGALQMKFGCCEQGVGA